MAEGDFNAGDLRVGASRVFGSASPAAAGDGAAGVFARRYGLPNQAESRCLAAVSHELRQPLQSLSLIAGMLGKTATDAASRQLLDRLAHSIGVLRAVTNAMLDPGRIDMAPETPPGMDALPRPAGPPNGAISPEAATRTIFIVDDDAAIRESLRDVFEHAGKHVQAYPDAESFLSARPELVEHGCLLVDAALPGMSGLQLLQKLVADDVRLPSIMVTGRGDIAMAVEAMKAGAADFLEKPVDEVELLASVRRILDERHGVEAIEARQRETARLIACLTSRQREVMERVLMGQPSKNIAADLGISQRTVENHRAAVMLKTGAGSIPELARLAVSAGEVGLGSSKSGQGALHAGLTC